MKKFLSTSILVASLASFSFAAGFVGSQDGAQLAQTNGARGGFAGPQGSQGGFVGPSVIANSVSAAKNAPDDAWVTLRGHITRQIAHEKYIFADATGEVVVDIDDKYLYGITITPKDLVEISGEVDKEFFESTEIDVKRVQIVK